MIKPGLLSILLLLNGVAIFCVINPWTLRWQSQGLTVLVAEAVALVLIGPPAIIYQMAWKKRPSGKACQTRSMP